MEEFWSLPLIVVVSLLLVAMVAAHEVGARLGLRFLARSNQDDNGSNDEGFILSGVLGLLALLMGFSFSMALNRLEDRRDLMLQETSAVGYFALLVEGLPQEQAVGLKTDLRRYAAARLEAAELADGEARVRADEQAAALRAPIAAAVSDVLRDSVPPGPHAVALAAAYDVVEDTAVRRQALAQAHLPARVLLLLAVYALISAAMLGNALAGSHSGHRVAPTTLYLLISLAFGVILDLDRPRAGAIVIDQAPFEQMVRGLGSTNAVR